MTLSRSFGARSVWRFATAGLLVAVTAHAAAAQRGQSRRGSRDARAEIDTTFAFDKNGTVTVNVPNGDVVVAGTTANQIRIRAKSENNDLRVDVSGSRVMIQTSNHEGGAELSVPQGVRVIVQSRSGDVTIRGTHGEVEVHATSGDINVDDVVGRLDVGNLSGDITVSNVAGDGDVSTTGGDVKLSNVRGNLGIGTVSGEIELRGITAKNVRARTTSGDVTYDGLIDPAGRYEFATHSGDVRLHIQRDASAQLTVSTWNGSIDSDFPITLRPGEHDFGSQSSKRFIFEIGGGAARLTAETFSGDIAISSNGRGATGRP
jgi:DUF4097 and DUF4098 domain-containing protein YvlB